MRLPNVALLVCFAPIAPSLASQAAVQATTTSLSLSSVSTMPLGTVETFTVQVDTVPNARVRRGVVNFYDGKRLIGTRAIIETGSGQIGKAVFKSLLPMGLHMLHAQYVGLGNTYAGSVSAAQALTVAGTLPITVGLTVADSGLYTFHAQISAPGSTAPSGNLTLLDITTGRTLATGSLETVSRIEFQQVQGISVNAAIGVASNGSILGPLKVPIADLNNDGTLDIVSNPNSLLGNGDGTFRPSPQLTGAYAGSESVDFNRDGIPDLMSYSFYDSKQTASVYLGDGTGSFVLGARSSSNGPGVSPQSYSVGDFNGDGIPDVTGFASGTGYVGDPAGNLAKAFFLGLANPYDSAAVVRDLNGDGNDDLVSIPDPLNDSFTVNLGNGDSTFRTRNVFAGIEPRGVAVDDMNGDGIPDLVGLGSRDGQGSVIAVLLGNGDGTFQSPRYSAPISGPDFAVGDVNGDGVPDIMTDANALLGNGDGTLAAPLSLPSFRVGTGTSRSFQLADFNHDGLADLIAYGAFYINATTSSATAAFQNVTVPGSGVHNIVAVYNGLQSEPVSVIGEQTAFSSVHAVSGFNPSTGLHLNGSAQLIGTALQLTGGDPFQAGSAWSYLPVQATSFTSDFHFKVTNPQADGFTFTIQNSSPSALGSAGGELGYNFIPSSVALKFDLFDNAGEGANSVGVYTAGNTLTGPGTVLPPDVSLLAGHTMLAHVTYDGFTLVLVLTDTSTGASTTYTKVVDIPGALQSDKAYVGFTGATGALTSTVQILDWTCTPGTLAINSAQGFTKLGLHVNGIAGAKFPQAINLAGDSNGDPFPGSAWSASPFDITRFHSVFTFTNNHGAGPYADGFTFALQRSGPMALGAAGGELGFNYIPNSVALKFDFFDNDGEGANSIGLYPAGTSLTDPAHSVHAGVDIDDANRMKADVTYDGTTLTLVLTEPASGQTFTWSEIVDLPSLIGGKTAFVGFTGATGFYTTDIFLSSWTLSVGTTE